MSVVLSDEQYRAARYAVVNIVHEHRLGGRSVPPTVIGLYRQMTQLTANGQGAVQFVCDAPELDAGGDDLIGTATAAVLLGWCERTVRRRAKELGGIRPAGRQLVFSRRSVAAFASRQPQGTPL